MKINQFIKTLMMGILLTNIVCLRVFAADQGNCGDNCWYTYKDGTLTYSVKDWNNPEGRAISIVNTNYNLSGSVTNVIVSEGIEEIKFDSKTNAHTIQSVGTPEGKFVLPSTLKNFGNSTGWDLNFGTIEINSSDLTIGSQTIACASSTAPLTLIVPNSSSVTFNDNAFYKWSGQYLAPGSLTVVCKSSNSDDCRESFGNSLSGNRLGNKVNFTNKILDENGKVVIEYYDTGYYKYDADGNIIENWNFDNTERYDEKENIIGKYDGKGNMLQSFVYGTDGSIAIYDANGKLIGLQGKRILTVEEASALVKNNKNTFTLKYR